MKKGSIDFGTIVIGFCVILIICLCILLYDSVQGCKEGCKKIGWDGYTLNDGGSCYKKEPHESGVGTVIVYSGKIECVDLG